MTLINVYLFITKNYTGDAVSKRIFTQEGLVCKTLGGFEKVYVRHISKMNIYNQPLILNDTVTHMYLSTLHLHSTA